MTVWVEREGLKGGLECWTHKHSRTHYDSDLELTGWDRNGKQHAKIQKDFVGEDYTEIAEKIGEQVKDGCSSQIEPGYVLEFEYLHAGQMQKDDHRPDEKSIQKSDDRKEERCLSKCCVAFLRGERERVE